MAAKIYIILSIFCGILSQGIIGSFLEDNHNNSSNLHLRKKRMIGHAFFGHGEWMITDVIHIVKVLQDDVKICAGVIVSPEHILTPRTCAPGPVARHTVESGAPHISAIKTHHVYDILYKGHISLLCIRPPIKITSPSLSRPIPLAKEPLSANMHLSIIAWGPTGQVRPITQVPIVNLLICLSAYNPHKQNIELENICTVQLPGHNRCSKEDVGSALVVGDTLFGILDRAGSVFSQDLPDVFTAVNGNHYYDWIMEHIEPYLRDD